MMTLERGELFIGSLLFREEGGGRIRDRDTPFREGARFLEKVLENLFGLRRDLRGRLCKGCLWVSHRGHSERMQSFVWKLGRISRPSDYTVEFPRGLVAGGRTRSSHAQK